MNSANKAYTPTVDAIANIRHALQRAHPFNLAIVDYLCDSALRAINGNKVVVLCGSSRYVDVMAVCAWIIERDEKAIAMSLHLLPVWYSANLVDDHLAEHEGVAAEMDELHLRKIDLASEIFVVNRKDYIGDSTRREIAYAEARSKQIRWYTHDPVGAEVERRITAFLQTPDKPAARPVIDEAHLRAEFERMCRGRDLSRHHLRGTYSSPAIAALWNQHVKTATMFADITPQEKA